ncbi:hypothetical protein BLNAU_14876 [Blattamonas nauphoetae]|uniref:Uncharacterized protein n=1 Tax=Blattamonas nauphoetae TaxID=2049346 RepID=A0ABQ9XG42_9EUKA|nr:hypothetical protein BLNAU_14876 [Blattamonas nauphoetae]
MEDEYPHQLTPNHSIVSNNSDADGRILSEREPFFNFDVNSDLSFEDKSRIYNSLAALVKEEFPFDNALQSRAVQFLESLEPNWMQQALANQLVTDLVPCSAGSHSGFIESILTLLSSPHWTVVGAALSFLQNISFASSKEIRDRLAESDLVSNVLATAQPHSLPISGNETILYNLIIVIILCFDIASPSSLSELGLTTAVDQSNHREMIFQKVVIPSSQFVSFLISNRRILTGLLLNSSMNLLSQHIQIGPFHRQTLEFVLASPIAMAFSSYLSFIERNDGDLWYVLININRSLLEWKNEGPEVVESAKRMMQALF